MKKEKLSEWVFLSIFYPEDEWYVLFQKGVIPFLEKYQSTHLYSYIIHFGKIRGDYIGLSCEVRAKEYTPFVTIAHTFFTDFISQFPAHCNHRSTITGESVFMNFPANTVCHSLHKFQPVVQGDKVQFLLLWHYSSIFCMNIYNDIPFDKEDFFTAALYLSVSLLLSNAKSGSAYLEKQIATYPAMLTNSAYNIQFNESEPVLKDLLVDCRQIIAGGTQEELKPVSAWFNLFNDYLQPHTDNIVLQSLLLEEILSNLRTQLCIISDGESFIDFCIIKLTTTDYALVPIA